MKRKVIDLVAPTKATPRKEPSPSLDDNFCEALCPQGKPRYECNVCGKQMQRSSNAKMAHILGQDVKGTRYEVACELRVIRSQPLVCVTELRHANFLRIPT
jgi:hypothetical protein